MMEKKKLQKKKEREKRIRARRVKLFQTMDAEWNLNLAMDAYNDGDRKSAAHYIQKALHLKPDWPHALRLKYQIACSERDFAGAIRCLEIIIRRDPEDLDAKFQRGHCHLMLHHYQEGMEALQIFLDAAKGVRNSHIREKKSLTRKWIKEARSFTQRENVMVSSRISPEVQLQGEMPVQKTPPAAKTASVTHAEPDVPLLDLSPFSDPRLLQMEVPVRVKAMDGDFFKHVDPHRPDDPADCLLRLEYHRLRMVREFEELLCLEHITNVDHYWYQVETVASVLKRFRGRVLLADEVGLGKTIEAGMLIKEYILRGLVRKVLVLTPPSLVSQWQEEMASKFGLPFVTSEHEDFRSDPVSFWKEQDLVITSINIAKSQKHYETITDIDYDLVIVDEAHYLRNKRTLNYRLVNAIHKRFIFLLSATPVQNNLIELYNLITLLQPGLLSTEAAFKQEYVKRGNLRQPDNPEKLRKLLREVMIRNIRSMVDVKLPRRFASTIYVSPTEVERETYEALSNCTRLLFQDAGEQEHFTLRNLQMAAGSSPFALRESLSHLMTRLRGTNGPVMEILLKIEETLSSVRTVSKGSQLLALLKGNSEKKIIFVRYLKTLEYLAHLLSADSCPFAVFSGAMSAREKDAAINAFRWDIPVLLSTETGGEGRNIQFCNTLINYDLPWNPMRLEQRIGRIHRIGQERDVFVFNLCLQGSIEDYMMRILDDKINMFELVIGEIDAILGNLESDRDFGSLILDIWMQSRTEEERRENFDRLGEALIEAKRVYEKTKVLDEALFGEDYEV